MKIFTEQLPDPLPGTTIREKHDAVLGMLMADDGFLMLEKRYKAVCQELHDVTAKRNDLSLKLQECETLRDQYLAWARERESRLQAAEKRWSEHHCPATNEIVVSYDDYKRQADAATAAESRLRTLAIGIVGARMAHVEEDYAEVYHLLYSAATALSDDPHEPWKALDALAAGAIERRDGQTFVNLPVVEKDPWADPPQDMTIGRQGLSRLEQMADDIATQNGLPSVVERQSLK